MNLGKKKSEELYELAKEKGTPVLEKTAAEVKEKAEEGDARALYIIGKCLQYGVALDKNNREARDCYEKAAEFS